MSDHAVMQETGQESIEAFEVFYDRAWLPVFRAVSLVIQDRDLAREAVDEAMARAFERWPTVSRVGNREGWVYRVALNWARSRLRRLGMARRRALGAPESYEQQLPDPELRRALIALPRHHRDVLVARLLLDMSESETAEVFGIPKGTVKSRLNRALRQLREELT